MFITPYILQKTSKFYKDFPKPWLLKKILQKVKGEKKVLNEHNIKLFKNQVIIVIMSKF